MAAHNLAYSIKSLTAWSRLEPRPRQEDFSRNLKAEIRDPLWMLTRQWQWGEFKGSDTGSAIFSKVHLENTKITRFQKRGNSETTEISGGKSNFDNSSAGIPMEARVEQRPIPMDFKMGLKIGLRFKKLLNNPAIYEEIRAVFSFDEVPSDIIESTHFKNNRKLNQTHNAVKNRVMDGRKLYSSLKNAGGYLTMVSDLPSVSISSKMIGQLAGINLIKWFDKLYLNGDSNNESWHPKHLEYQFSCKIPATEPNGIDPVDMDLLVAKEYYHGKLDWYSFDFNKTPGESNKTDMKDINTSTRTKTIFTTMPNGINFPGVPNQRWWEFEDGYVDLGNIDANTNDTARILFAEFGLVYGNDWNIVPYEIPVGSLSEVKSIVVTDNFGIKTVVNAAGTGVDNSWQDWSMFNVNVENDKNPDAPRDNRLFIPPVVQHVQESKPIESINFIKDEISNMVWAIESIIPNELGGGMNGYESARFLIDQLTEGATPEEVPRLADTFAKYILSSTVPENWIPFIPVKLEGQTSREIQFQRAVMPRIIPGKDMEAFAGGKFVRPRSILLSESQDGAAASEGYFVYEEEVPRAGTIVSRTFQRVRWFDGTTHVWVGMRKTTGKGEGSSGLRFDELE